MADGKQSTGLAEDLEIPWPAKPKSTECEKVRFRAEALRADIFSALEERRGSFLQGWRMGFLYDLKFL